MAAGRAGTRGRRACGGACARGAAGAASGGSAGTAPAPWARPRGACWPGTWRAPATLRTSLPTHDSRHDTCIKRQPKDQLTCNSCILCGAPPYAKLGPCPLPGPPTPGMRSSFPAPPGLERSSGAWYRGTVHPPPKLWSMGLSGARYTGSKGRAP